MGVHCTAYILNKTMMINQEKGKEVVKKYKVKVGLEQRLSYIIRIMFINYRVKKILKIKFIHMKHSFLQI